MYKCVTAGNECAYRLPFSTPQLRKLSLDWMGPVPVESAPQGRVQFRHTQRRRIYTLPLYPRKLKSSTVFLHLQSSHVTRFDTTPPDSLTSLSKGLDRLHRALIA
jgi:hypothetical protein